MPARPLPTDPDRPTAETAEAPGTPAGADGLVHAMPDALANKIAAGEVVQRPASVVKELVENAIDAGAESVDLIVKRAGSELVQVVDDGCGMGPRDAVACFGRHATSKLRAFEDLDTLQTLGFRGEALASIGAVARVELRTRRQQDAAGVAVRVEDGAVAAPTPVATPAGTSLAIRDLFYNVPARRAFLRSPATEFKHIVETFQALALSHPRVAFSLTHDDQEVYRLAAASAGTADEALARRVVDLLGAAYAGQLVPVGEGTSYLSIRGLVGAPEVARKSRGDQYVFINGRFVRSRSLEHAAAAAYGALLPEGRRPFLALFLDVDPRHVDVNVHPTKTEVKFDDERGVYSFVRAVVKKGLAEAGLALDLVTSPTGLGLSGAAGENAPRAAPAPPLAPLPSFPPLPDSGSAAPLPASPAAFPAALPAVGAPTPGDGAAGPPPRSSEPADPFAASAHAGTLPPLPSGPIPSRADELPLEMADRPEADRAVWSFRGRYLFSPVASGLLVIHIRAARERIEYERALAVLDGGMGLSQQLLFAYTLDLSPADRALFDELAPDLRALGFEFHAADGGPVEVRGVPADVGARDQRAALSDLLDRYRRTAGALALPSRELLARSVARRNALGDDREPTPAEARRLIDELFACADPFIDPAGRPTTVRLAEEELARRFGE